MDTTNNLHVSPDGMIHLKGPQDLDTILAALDHNRRVARGEDPMNTIPTPAPAVDLSLSEEIANVITLLESRRSHGESDETRAIDYALELLRPLICRSVPPYTMLLLERIAEGYDVHQQGAAGIEELVAAGLITTKNHKHGIMAILTDKGRAALESAK